MFEAYRRAHVSHTYRNPHFRWKTRIPDGREGVGTDADLEEPAWFKAQSSFFHHPPSTILVEEVAAPVHYDAKRKTQSQARKPTGTAVSRRSTLKPRGMQKGTRELALAKTEARDGVTRRLELTTEGFWDFLYSDRWEETCLLRVLEGELLDNLLAAFYLLQKNHDVISYVTIAYIENNYRSGAPVEPRALSNERDTAATDVEQVLVELDYLCRQQRPADSTSNTEGTGVRRDEDPKARKSRVSPRAHQPTRAHQHTRAHQPTIPSAVSLSVLSPRPALLESPRASPAEKAEHDAARSVSPKVSAVSRDAGTEFPVIIHTSGGSTVVSSVQAATSRTKMSDVSSSAEPASECELTFLPPRKHTAKPTVSALRPAERLFYDPQSTDFGVPSAEPKAPTQPTTAGVPLSDTVSSVSFRARARGGPYGSLPELSARRLPLDVPKRFSSSVPHLPSVATSYMTKTSRITWNRDQRPSEEENKRQQEKPTALPPTRCNIRGLMVPPPPHTGYFRSSPMTREPFYNRREREGCVLKPVKLPAIQLKGWEQCMMSKTRRDAQIISPAKPPQKSQKRSSGTELVAEIPYLEPTKDGEHTQDPSSFYLDVTPDEDARPAKTKTKKKKTKHVASDESDSDTEEDEEEQYELKVDRARVKQFEDDLAVMSTELYVNPASKKSTEVPLSKHMREELKEKSAAPFRIQATCVDPSSAASKQQFNTAEGSDSDPECDRVKKWERCPTFQEFFQYLQEEELKQEEQLGKRGVRKQKPSKRVGTKAQREAQERENAKKRGRLNKQTRRSPSSPSSPLQTHRNMQKTLELMHTTVRFAYLAGGVCDSVGVRNALLRRRQTLITMLEESHVETKTRAKTLNVPLLDYMKGTQKSIRKIDFRKKKEEEEREEDQLFKEMGLDDIHVFDIKKLKHSYSFERIFNSRMQKIGLLKYFLLLREFEKPGPSRKTGKKVFMPWDLVNDLDLQADWDDEPESPPPKPPTPPMVLGKLRDFSFLKYRDHVSGGCTLSPPPSVMTIDEVRDRLEQAMEVFVVRKERATTTRNFESKVSVTFTRRRATGHEGGLIMADTDSVVTVVCQTLKESDRSRNTGLVPC